EMVIVVFRREEQMIDESHRLLQAWVQHRSRDRCWLKLLDVLHKPEPLRAERCQNLGQLPGVVVGFVGFAVAEIRGRERVLVGQEVLDAREPQRLEIEQMSRVLLRRPLVARLRDHHIARHAAQHLLQSRGRSSKTNAQVQKLLNRKCEFKLAIEPQRNLTHTTYKSNRMAGYSTN